MFERFADDARHAIVAAQQVARELSHNHIGTEHLLLGVLRVQGSAGERVLRSLEVSFDGVRELALRILGIGETTTEDAIPFTARARRVLESALGEAQDVGSTEIGSEHIVLALVKGTEGVAARILLDFGVTADAIGTAVGRLRPVPRRSRPEDEIPREHDPFGIGDLVFEGRVDFGWRGHAIVLAALGAATLTRAAFAPTRTGGLSELECSCSPT